MISAFGQRWANIYFGCQLIAAHAKCLLTRWRSDSRFFTFSYRRLVFFFLYFCRNLFQIILLNSVRRLQICLTVEQIASLFVIRNRSWGGLSSMIASSFFFIYLYFFLRLTGFDAEKGISVLSCRAVNKYTLNLGRSQKGICKRYLRVKRKAKL